MSGNWYLRSLGDGDTHYGSRNAEGKVVPLCYVDPFEPRPRMVVVGSPTDLSLRNSQLPPTVVNAAGITLTRPKYWA